MDPCVLGRIIYEWVARPELPARVDKISTGDITIIRCFKDNEDFDAGYEYLANPGDSYIVPCHYRLER